MQLYISGFWPLLYDAVYLSNSCRYFNDPHPKNRVVSEAVSSFKWKGKDCPYKSDLFYDLEDFNETFFNIWVAG